MATPGEVAAAENALAAHIRSLSGEVRCEICCQASSRHSMCPLGQRFYSEYIQAATGGKAK